MKNAGRVCFSLYLGERGAIALSVTLRQLIGNKEVLKGYLETELPERQFEKEREG